MSLGRNISGSALAPGAPGTVSGSTVTFAFGTVVNAPDQISDEGDQITINVVGRVTDRAENVSGVRVTNTATLTYDFGTATDDAVAEVVEPHLDVQKTVTPAAGDAGDAVTYTVTVTHLPDSTAAALALVINDLLNVGNLQLVVGSVAVTGAPGFVVTCGNAAGDTTVAVAGPVLLLGSSLTITYQARLTGAPAPGATVPNTATSTTRASPGRSAARTPTAIRPR